MIKPDQYKKQGNVPYVTSAMIKACHTKKEARRFSKWFGIGTQLALPNGEGGIYTWDYENWIESGMPTCQGADWD